MWDAIVLCDSRSRTQTDVHKFGLSYVLGPVGKQVKGGYLLRYKRKYSR